MVLTEQHHLARHHLAHQRLGLGELAGADHEVKVDLQGLQGGQGVTREVRLGVFMGFPGEVRGVLGAPFHRGVSRRLMGRLQDERVEFLRRLRQFAGQRAGALEGLTRMLGGCGQVALLSAKRGQGQPALGDVGIAGELRHGFQHRQGLRQQGAGAGEILGPQAGLGGVVAGHREFAGRTVGVGFARLHRPFEQGELLGELLTLEVMHAQVGQRVGQQGARHRGRLGETDRLVQQCLGLEVLAGAAQGDYQVQQGVDDQAGTVAPREAAHV